MNHVFMASKCLARLASLGSLGGAHMNHVFMASKRQVQTVRETLPCLNQTGDSFLLRLQTPKTQIGMSLLTVTCTE